MTKLAWFPGGVAALLVTAAPLHAGDPPALAPRAVDLVGQIDGTWKRFADRGVSPQIAYYGEVFGNLSGGLRRGAAAEGLLTLSLALDLEKLAGWKGARVFCDALYPHGLGISGRYTGDADIVSNIDAYDSFRLRAAWLQQDLAGGRLSIRAGMVNIDSDFFAADSAALYINSAFGIIGTVTFNIDSPIYPVAAPGVLVKLAPSPGFYLEAMIVSDDPGAPDGNNKHGTRFRLAGDGGAIVFAEAGFHRTGSEGAPVLEGSYKVGGYYATASFDDVHGGPPHHGNGALYVVAEQQIFRAPTADSKTFRGLTGFARASIAPADRNDVPFYFDAGLNYTGLLPGRPRDTLGIGFSYERWNSDLRTADGERVPSHHEHVLEATYLATLNDHLALQPDFQYIFNPGATGTTPNAVVAGLRFILTF
jgi:porin